MTTAVGAAVTINVLDPHFYVDPWDAYAWLRDEAPVFWDPVQKLSAISRYEDVVTVERDGARYLSFSGSRPHIDLSADKSMINLDDPAHQANATWRAPIHGPRGARPRGPHPPRGHGHPGRGAAGRRVWPPCSRLRLRRRLCRSRR
jgi:cytochrome P450 family 142 subfamily A polypeptide 1